MSSFERISRVVHRTRWEKMNFRKFNNWCLVNCMQLCEVHRKCIVCACQCQTKCSVYVLRFFEFVPKFSFRCFFEPISSFSTINCSIKANWNRKFHSASRVYQWGFFKRCINGFYHPIRLATIERELIEWAT